ncbi:MAG: hypothetical protein GY950_07280 [bacterium]|nr:hypothetical protein [bacterium]
MTQTRCFSGQAELPLFIEKVDFMLAENNRLHKTADGFIRLFQSKWSNLNITGRISEWYKLSFDDFRKELEKQKIKLPLQEQAEWLQYFNEQKQKAMIIQSSIAKTDNEIDKMVYELYELTDEEIKIVELASKKKGTGKDTPM